MFKSSKHTQHNISHNVFFQFCTLVLPMGCLATEREVEYLSSGCSFKSTEQLAGAMAFCGAK